MLPRFTLIIAIAITTLFMASCSGNKIAEQELDAKPIKVIVATPSENNGKGISVSGKVESIQTAYISTKLMGTITGMNVKLGDRVKKGQVLATISDEDIRAKRSQVDAMIDEAEANFNNAQKDMERFEALYKQKSATAKELDNISLQYSSAKARLQSARQMRNELNATMRYSTLTAPFDGIITQKNAEAGTMASPGMPLLAVEQSGKLQVNASIPESDINTIKIGTEAMVNIKSSGKKFTGKITEINPSSQFSGGQYMARIDIPASEAGGIYSGMFVNVFIPINNQSTKDSIADAIMIPLSSLVKKEQLTGIYTISSNNTALLRLVRVGKTYGDKVEIISGLGKNEKYITSADGNLFNGAPVALN